MRRHAALAGAAVLVAAAILRLPAPSQLRRAATPFDRTRDPGAGPAFLVLTSASALVPEGATVAVVSASGDAADSDYGYRMGLGLLPGRRVRRDPDGAEFVVVLGVGENGRDFGHLLRRLDQGSIWRSGP